MFDKKKFFDLFKANILIILTPILVLFVLSKFIDQRDYAVFIASYALVLFLGTIVDFGSRHVFMLNDDIILQNSADFVKVMLAGLATIFFALFVCFREYDYVVLFLIGGLWKDVFMPIYKFKDELHKYNAILISSVLIIALGALLVLYFKRVSFIYIAMFTSALPFWYYNRLNFIEFSTANVIRLIKLSGNFAVSNVLVGLGQNGSKILLLTIASPSVLVGYEIVSKLANIGRYAINVVVEYLQVKKLRLSVIELLGISLGIQLSGLVGVWILKNAVETYFEINASALLLQSFIYFPLVLIGYSHKIMAILLNKTRVVLSSIAIANLAFFIFVYFSNHIDLNSLVLASVSVEYIVLIITMIGIKR